LFHLYEQQALLLKKSAELFGGGKWNGLGGKINRGETPEQACVREVFEESGLRVSKLRYHGLLKFWFGGKLDWVWRQVSLAAEALNLSRLVLSDPSLDDFR